MYIGKKQKINNSYELSYIYEQTARSNEESAEILLNNYKFQESSYMFIQAMEKQLKVQICKKIDATNPYFSNKLREIGHNIDDSVKFLIEIYTGNNMIIREQMEKQLINGIFNSLRFRQLNNDLRYPKYDSKNNRYVSTVVSRDDCEELKQMNLKLKKYLQDLSKI